MADELQHLIERIRKEAVEAGEKEAADLVAKAREKAAALVREAEEKARARREEAEKAAEQFAERARQTIAQASRDLLISVGQGVENIVGDLADAAARDALGPEALQQILVGMAEAYFARGGSDSRIEALCSPEDQQRLLQFFKGRYHQLLEKGLTLHADNRVFRGFKVSLAGGRVYHDFTQEAIAEALANFLRPHLAEIVTRAARGGSGSASQP